LKFGKGGGLAVMGWLSRAVGLIAKMIDRQNRSIKKIFEISTSPEQL
jgi:hypothetical protein